MNLTEAEFLDLTSTKNEAEWDAACDRVKAARDGAYPPDWWPRMMLSGVIHRHFKTWETP